MLKELSSLEDTIISFEDDIHSFEENNISQLRLLILFIDNEKVTNGIEKKINMKNKQLSNNELIHHIQNINELKDYKIQYLLNFTIEKSPYELVKNTNMRDLYKLNAITNLKTFNVEQNQYCKNVSFTSMNTLIIIANKNNKYYIKRSANLTKNNTSKKNIKS
jgi:hypothetical protein